MTTRGATCLPPLQPPCVRAPGLLASPSCLPCPRSGQAPFYDKRAAVLGKLGFETGGSVMATVRVTCLQGWGPRPRSMGGGRLVGAGASPLPICITLASNRSESRLPYLQLCPRNLGRPHLVTCTEGGAAGRAPQEKGTSSWPPSLWTVLVLRVV